METCPTEDQGGFFLWCERRDHVESRERESRVSSAGFSDDPFSIGSDGSPSGRGCPRHVISSEKENVKRVARPHAAADIVSVVLGSKVWK